MHMLNNSIHICREKRVTQPVIEMKLVLLQETTKKICSTEGLPSNRPQEEKKELNRNYNSDVGEGRNQRGVRP